MIFPGSSSSRTHSSPPSGRKLLTLVNGAYAVAEYVTQPLGMLFAAPYLLRHLGVSQFGIWMLASAAVSSGSLLSSGFGDAAVKYVAMYRGRNDRQGVARVVRGMLAINLMLGGLLAVVLWSLAPYAVHHIANIDPVLERTCLQSFRIGSLLLVVRSIDSVFVSTLRAVERYSPAIRIAMFSRIAALVAAIGLAAEGVGVSGIMVATLCISAFAVVAQAIAVRVKIGEIVLLPSLHRETIAMVAGFGGFSWLQAAAAVAFSQADRLVVGFFLGAPAVAVYSICAQAAQPVHGILGSGFHALFPHLSSRSETEPLADLRHTVSAAFKTNLVLAAILATPMILLSRSILSLWMGQDFARQAWLILSILAGSFALLAVNVTAHYTLLAIGLVRRVTYLNLAAGAAMLLLMLVLTPKFGIVGTACARLIYGPITWAMYYPLYIRMRGTSAGADLAVTSTAWENS